MVIVGAPCSSGLLIR